MTMIQADTTTLMKNDVTIADSSTALLPSHSRKEKKQGGSNSGRHRRPFVLVVGVLFCLVAGIVLAAKNKHAGVSSNSSMTMMRSSLTGGALRTGRNQYVAPTTPLPTPSSAFTGANRPANPNSRFVTPSSSNTQARKNDPRALPTTLSGNAPAHGRTSPGTGTAQRNGWKRSSSRAF
mmetsp:Transcript_3756/g.4270  ORF Transcript_3756/g.4270 Transcript_3756/m.4270 type:complete len:178 (-) Transcript_3756:126-659(-)